MSDTGMVEEGELFVGTIVGTVVVGAEECGTSVFGEADVGMGVLGLCNVSVVLSTRTIMDPKKVESRFEPSDVTSKRPQSSKLTSTGRKPLGHAAESDPW